MEVEALASTYIWQEGTDMASNGQRLPVAEKVGYAMGDVATNFFFQSMILYQTRFYTDTVGLSAVATVTGSRIVTLPATTINAEFATATATDSA